MKGRAKNTPADAVAAKKRMESSMDARQARALARKQKQLGRFYTGISNMSTEVMKVLRAAEGPMSHHGIVEALPFTSAANIARRLYDVLAVMIAVGLVERLNNESISLVGVVKHRKKKGKRKLHKAERKVDAVVVPDAPSSFHPLPSPLFDNVLEVDALDILLEENSKSVSPKRHRFK